jgi:HSP20 family protein
MTTGTNNKLIAVLVGLLVVVVAAQSVVMVKLYQRSEAPIPKPSTEPIQMDIQPSARPGPSPSGGTPQPKWNPPVPAVPFGGLGYNPGMWDPFQEFRSMRQQMDQMFNDSFGRFRQTPDFESLWDATAFSPSMDVEEKGGNYVVRMDIPGADKSNISINIDDRLLTVSGKVDETIEEQDKNQLRKERLSGEFKRALTLPGPVTADEMEARYKDGVLTITVPKGAEQGGSRSIQIL